MKLSSRVTSSLFALSFVFYFTKSDAGIYSKKPNYKNDSLYNRAMIGLTYGMRSLNINSTDVYYNKKQLDLGSGNAGNFGLFMQANQGKLVIHVNGEIFGTPSGGWGLHVGAGWKLVNTKYFTIAPLFLIGGGIATNNLGSFEVPQTSTGGSFDLGYTVGESVFLSKDFIMMDPNGNEHPGSDIQLNLNTNYFNLRPMFQAQVHLSKFTLHADVAYNFALSNDATISYSGVGYTKEEWGEGKTADVKRLSESNTMPHNVKEDEVDNMKNVIKNSNGNSLSSNPVKYNGFLWNIGLAYTFGPRKK